MKGSLTVLMRVLYAEASLESLLHAFADVALSNERI